MDARSKGMVRSKVEEADILTTGRARLQKAV